MLCFLDDGSGMDPSKSYYINLVGHPIMFLSNHAINVVVSY